jgi:anti-anti-sigma factor
MFTVNETDDKQCFRFSSHVHLIDRVIDSCRPFVNERDPRGGDAGLCQLLRELLLNAVEHGNGGDARKKVECELERTGDGRYRVMVADGGEGIDSDRLALEPSDDAGQERNRGYAIINTIADELRFEPAKARVTAFVTLPTGTVFERTETARGWVVTPSGDITAAVADEFRHALLAWADGDAPAMRLNMEKVSNVDSICLSVLVSFSKTLEGLDNGRAFEIVNVQPDMMNLFVMTRLGRLYTIREYGASTN